MTSHHTKLIAENRKARFNYFIEEEFEAGVVLKGTEVKSLRMGKVNIKDSYAKIQNGEVFIYQLHIGEYPFAHYGNHEPLRPRKLLMHKAEIKRLYGKINEKGFTLVPLKMYFKDGKVKIVIALARGKQLFDKRESIRRKDMEREQARMHRVGRYTHTGINAR
ncbi:SsrA-binding protein SmpB [Desulfatirhabdium butyrativorans]|uniref:SsrA-binding protein SmpB n=1 Tax=Desulfatirhabdium butyrativorans TaxID=340467 RepID=UPI0004024A76|nr:SsrA-binding protein SmpB [Desulfatirhabdium butyrativorans]